MEVIRAQVGKNSITSTNVKFVIWLRNKANVTFHCYISLLVWQDLLHKCRWNLGKLHCILGKCSGENVWHTNLTVMGLTTCRLCVQPGLMCLSVRDPTHVGPSMRSQCRQRAAHMHSKERMQLDEGGLLTRPLGLHTNVRPETGSRGHLLFGLRWQGGGCGFWPVYEHLA